MIYKIRNDWIKNFQKYVRGKLRLLDLDPLKTLLQNLRLAPAPPARARAGAADSPGARPEPGRLGR